jgi:hypothetical protein
MNRKIEQLFAEYEHAFSNLDFKKSASFFTDTFISAGPKGAIARNREEFLAKAGQASEFYKSAGQTSAKVLSLKEMPVSDQYTMVTIHWGVTFIKTGSEVVEFDVSYLVQLTADEPKIILFIAHQDEDEAMRKLALTQNA